MGRVKRSKDAVVRALANLRTHGFLDWLRRWEDDKVPSLLTSIRTPKAKSVSASSDNCAAHPPEEDAAGGRAFQAAGVRSRRSGHVGCPARCADIPD
jgi:hypothetical protein